MALSNLDDDSDDEEINKKNNNVCFVHKIKCYNQSDVKINRA